MQVQNTAIAAGEVIVLTTGCYSDFGISGYIVACKDFDIKAVAEKFIQANQKKLWSYQYSDLFTAYLISEEYAVPVAHREIHLSDYSDTLLGIELPSKKF